jgi:phage FluMu protein Com
MKDITIKRMCGGCKTEKSLDEFYKKKTGEHGHASTCIKCAEAYRKNNKDKMRNYYIKNKELYANRYSSNRDHFKKYHRNIRLKRVDGITYQMKKDMIVNQDNRCAICLCDLTILNPIKVHVDHIHGSNFIRGILCQKCNMLLGSANDDAFILIKAANYILNNIKKKCLKDSGIEI